MKLIINSLMTNDVEEEGIASRLNGAARSLGWFVVGGASVALAADTTMLALNNEV